MVIAYNSVNGSSEDPNPSWSHTVPSGLQNTLMIVGIMAEGDGGIPSANVTCGGTAMTKVAEAPQAGCYDIGLSIWMLHGVTSGAKTIDSNLSNTYLAVGHSVLYTGCRQLSEADASGINSGAESGRGNEYCTVNVVRGGCWMHAVGMIIDCKGSGSEGITSLSTQRRRSGFSGNHDTSASEDTNAIVSPGSHQIGFDINTTDTYDYTWAMAAVSFAPPTGLPIVINSYKQRRV